ELATFPHDLRVALRRLGFELGDLVPCGLPFLSRSDRLLGHFVPPFELGSPARTDSVFASDATGSRKAVAGRPRASADASSRVGARPQCVSQPGLHNLWTNSLRQPSTSFRSAAEAQALMKSACPL